MRRSLHRIRAVLTAALAATLGVAGLVTVTPAVAGAATYQWNFQPANRPVPAGWTAVDGSLFRASVGYGWVTDGGPRQCGDRNKVSDQVLDTFCHAQTIWSRQDGRWVGTPSPAVWEAVIPNGTYEVTVTVGDSRSNPRSVRHSVQVEGVSFLNRVRTTKSDTHQTATRTVTVSDGRLTVSFDGGTHTKIVAVTARSTDGGGGGTTTTTRATTTTTQATTTTTRATTTTTTAPPPPSGQAMTFFKMRHTTNGDSYVRDNDYSSPVGDNLSAWVNRKATMTLTTHSKRDTYPMKAQICAWQRGPRGEWQGPGTDEACSPLFNIPQSGSATYTLPEPSTWWAKSGRGNYDWSEKTDAVGIMIKDGNNIKYLMMYTRCGAACHPNGEAWVKSHLPLDISVEVTFRR